jgi:perosamine synthetase
MVVSKDRAIIDAVRDYRQFDCRRDSKVRFNFQMTDLQAAIGRVQLRRLPEFLAGRQRIFEKYSRSGMQLLDASPLDVHHPAPVRYRAVLKTATPQRRPESLPHALELSRTTVSLPIYPSLSDAAADRVIAAVQNTLPGR